MAAAASWPNVWSYLTAIIVLLTGCGGKLGSPLSKASGPYLSFVDQAATSGVAGNPLLSQPIVVVMDASNKRMISSAAPIELSLHTDAACATAALSINLMGWDGRRRIIRPWRNPISIFITPMRRVRSSSVIYDRLQPGSIITGTRAQVSPSFF